MAAAGDKRCTVFVRNLSFEATHDDLRRTFEMVGPVRQAFVINDRAGKSRGFGFVEFSLASDAKLAAGQSYSLHGRSLQAEVTDESRSGKKQLAKSKEAARPPPPAGTAAGGGGAAAPRGPAPGGAAAAAGRGSASVRANRLIVRNLSFDCTEDNLRDTFAQFGELVEAHIPGTADSRRGFGFVMFAERGSAQQAVDGGNGAKIHGRPVAVDWCQSKATFEQQKVTAAEPAALPPTAAEAVDAAADAMRAPDVSDESENERSEGSDSDEDSEESDDDDGGGAGGAAFQGEEAENPNPERVRKQRSGGSSAVDTTVFVRNVFFDTDEKALRAAFQRFGRIYSCKVTRDEATGRHRGTAFVTFSSAAEAAAAVEASATAQVAEPVLESSKILQQSKMARSSLAVGGVECDGRQLLVSKAVSREQATQLKEEKREERESKDKRNLYLQNEGLIRPGDAAAEGLTEAELSLRARAQQKKSKDLRDPNNAVSATRLCVRNVPIDCDEKMLRKVFAKALPAQEGGATDANKRLVQVKVVRDADSGRSRGFAFVECIEHADSLAVLRTVNNNPSVFNKLAIAASEDNEGARSSHRLMVEFAVVNSRVMQKINRKLESRAKDKHEKGQKHRKPGRGRDGGLLNAKAPAGGAEAGPDGAVSAKDAKRAKKQEQLRKKKEKRMQKRKAAQGDAYGVKPKPVPRAKGGGREGRKRPLTQDDLLLAVPQTGGERREHNEKQSKRTRRSGKVSAEEKGELHLTKQIDAYKQKFGLEAGINKRWFDE